MSASACLTLGSLHFFSWYRERQALGNLFFALLAASTAAYTLLELQMLRAETPEQFSTTLRWIHVPGFLLIVSMASFLHVYLKGGSRFLVRSICALRVLALILNFSFGQNLNFLEINQLRHTRLLGESVSVAEGVRNPCMLVGQASMLLLLVLANQAFLAAWRRGERRRALVVGGSAIFFIAVGMGHLVLVLWGIIPGPIISSLTFLSIVAAMSFELSAATLRAVQLGGELRESESRMALAAEAARLGIWSRDLVGGEIWGSDTWRELLGFSKSERIDLNSFLDKLHPEDKQTVHQILTQDFALQFGYQTEYRVLLSDGQVRWIASRGRVETNDQGTPVRLLGVSMDITYHREAQQEIELQRTELAHLSRVTMLGELSGSIAHELNQPLTAILSNAQAAQHFLARGEVDLDELREILSDIVEQDKRAGEVIRRLRLLLQKGEVLKQPLDPNDLVREVLRLLGSEFSSHCLVVQTHLDPTVPTVNGDRVQLLQVLLNLLLNACEATKGGASEDRHMVVATARSDEGVCFSVADRGPGIPPEKLTEVFAPFVTTKTQGLGLGLSVCQSIVSAHGGQLWASNNCDRGATFYFTLPFLSEVR